MPLPATNPRVTERFLRNDRAQLYIREVGEGQPIIVLHGGPEFDHRYLLPELDCLSDSVRLVYYDQRGRGRSYSGEGAQDVTLASEIDDLDRVRQSLGCETVAVLGHSWGGQLAMEYAVQHPDRVSHLILMNTAAASHRGLLALKSEVARRRTAGEREQLAALVASPGYQQGDLDADAEFLRIHFRTAFADPRHLDRVLPRLRAFTPEAIVAARAICDRLEQQTWVSPAYDLTPQLRSLRTPALLIHGDSDMVPVDVVADIAAAIPTSRLTVLPDCGHFSYLEKPESVKASITDFFIEHGA